MVKKPVLIFGYPRSGTTLLRAVLSQHSNITLVHEPELIFALRHAGYEITSKFAWANRENLLNQLKQIGLSKRHLERLSESVLLDFTNCKESLSFTEVYERLLPRPDSSHVVWGEKSLNNLFFVRELIELYPNALLIHIVRDARSAALSNLRKKQTRVDTLTNRRPFSGIGWLQYITFLAKHALLWKCWMSIGKSSMQLVPAGSWIEVRYENFLREPRERLQEICDAIGIAFEESMLDPNARRSDPVLSSETAYAHRKIGQELDESRAYVYLEELPLPLIWVVEQYAGDVMQQFGYHLLRPRLRVWEHLVLKIILAKNRIGLQYEVETHLNRRLIMNPTQVCF